MNLGCSQALTTAAAGRTVGSGSLAPQEARIKFPSSLLPGEDALLVPGSQARGCRGAQPPGHRSRKNAASARTPGSAGAGLQFTAAVGPRASTSRGSEPTPRLSSVSQKA